MSQRFTEQFVKAIAEGKQFDFNDFKTYEEFVQFDNELKEFNKNPHADKYKELLQRRIELESKK